MKRWSGCPLPRVPRLRPRVLVESLRNARLHGVDVLEKQKPQHNY
jgi:hypothetical protein